MCLTSLVSRYVMVANSAPVPQTALPSVNQSARWNSRIMENGLGGLVFIFFVFSSMMPAQCHAVTRSGVHADFVGVRRVGCYAYMVRRLAGQLAGEAMIDIAVMGFVGAHDEDHVA